MNADQRGSGGDSEVVSFPNWKEVLAAEVFAPEQRAQIERAISAFLEFCKRRRAPASVILIKEYLAVRERQGRSESQNPEPECQRPGTNRQGPGDAGARQAREALRWWFRAATRSARRPAVEQEAAERREDTQRATDSDRPTTAGRELTSDDGRRRAEGGGRTTDDGRRRAEPETGTRKADTQEPMERTETSGLAGRPAIPASPTPDAIRPETTASKLDCADGGPVLNQAYSGKQHTSRPSTPPLARDDLGSSEWERALIRESRERGFLFRTETTYREWAAKFATFLRPRTPQIATKEDVGAFLSKLAVTQRASPSTQKQALRVKDCVPRGLVWG